MWQTTGQILNEKGFHNKWSMMPQTGLLKAPSNKTITHVSVPSTCWWCTMLS